jgi:hypothetical protein
MKCMTRELVAEDGDGDPIKHVAFTLWDRKFKRFLRPSEVVEAGIVLSSDGRLLRYSPSFHWKIGQCGPTPVLLSQDVSRRFEVCVKVARG